MSAEVAEREPEEEDEDDNAPAGSLIMAILGWTLLTAVVLMAFFSAVGSLNRDLYSPSGFVRTYLQMVAAHDVAGALGVAGVSDGLPERGSAESALLDPRALGELRDIRIVSDEAIGNGRHRVTAAYELVSGGRAVSGRTEFTVRSTLPLAGLLNGWRFEASPLATLTAVVQTAPGFDVGRVHLNTGMTEETGATGTAYTVLVPAVYTLSLNGHYLHGAPASVAVTKIGDDARGYLDVQATQNLVSAVQTEIDEFLTDCAAQAKLFPAGCPFGRSIDDRIVSAPSWTVVTLPTVRVIRGFGAWYVPSAEGLMRLSVEVRSLYDGTVSSQVYDVPFTVSPRLEVASDDTVTLTW